MAKQFSFGELDKNLSKVSEIGSILTENKFSKIDEYIPTGNYILNAQLSGSLFGGIPNTRSVALSGESGVGKSFMCLNIAREAQKMGYYIIYCDSEAAIDEDIVRKFGIDPEKVRYQPVNTIKSLKNICANLHAQLKEKKEKGYELPKIMVIVDSIGNLATDKERNDALSGSDKKDMTRAGDIRSMFRIITTDLAEMKIPLVFTNHSYTSVGSYVPQQIMTGGGGAIYAPSMILMLSKANLKENNKEAEKAGMTKTGVLVTSKPGKNRFARPIPVKFHISFYNGMNPYVGLERYVSWETVGIGPGKLEEKIEERFLLDEDGNPLIKRGKQLSEKVHTGEFIYIPDDSANPKTFAVKHLGKTIKAGQLFTQEVFTDEILKEIDEKIIKPTFELPEVVDSNGTGDLFDDYEEDSDDFIE
jgi:RecA/RadA recombinase